MLQVADGFSSEHVHPNRPGKQPMPSRRQLHRKQLSQSIRCERRRLGRFVGFSEMEADLTPVPLIEPERKAQQPKRSEMGRLLLVIAAMIAMGGVSYGQSSIYGQPPSASQQALPGSQLSTCSQTADFCNRGCESVVTQGRGNYGRVACLARCREHQTDCMTSGFWTNPATGRRSPKQRQ
jgi:hypothetical protein